jgi:hypothetical protein
MDEIKGLDSDAVNPAHYRRGNYELIDVLEAWELHHFGHLMQAVQYLFRVPHKGQFVEDCKKAIWYVERAVEVYLNESPLTCECLPIPEPPCRFCEARMDEVPPQAFGVASPRFRTATEVIKNEQVRKNMIKLDEAISRLNSPFIHMEDELAASVCVFCDSLICSKGCKGYHRQQYLLGCDVENTP